MQSAWGSREQFGFSALCSLILRALFFSLRPLRDFLNHKRLALIKLSESV